MSNFNRFSKTKKIICSITLSFALLLSAFTGVNISLPSTTVSAENRNNIVEDVTTSLMSSGYNFNVATSSTPTSPSGWTALDSSSYNSDNIVKGVVNVETADSFDTEECHTSRPTNVFVENKNTEKDPGYYKNLMINSYSGAGRLGYETTSSISLAENSFYQISVTLYTHRTTDVETQKETDPTASIYITGLLDEDDDNYKNCAFESISTLTTLKEYSFYIDTNEAKSIKLQLWLGSKKTNTEGAVFFNKVRILRYSEDAYDKQLTGKIDTENNDFNKISLRETVDEPVNNSSFETPQDAWEQIARSKNASVGAMKAQIVDANTFAGDKDVKVTTPGSNNATGNNYALFMYNKEDGYQAVESEQFTVEKHKYYRLSFWAKSDCNVGTGAIVKLVDKAEESPADSASLTLATTVSSGSDTFRNDWTRYSFYIYGPAQDNKNVTIQVWLGTEESPTSGYVFVDDFTIKTISYGTFSNNSSASNSTTFNLNNSADKYTVANSDFDKTENENADDIYPATPASWTKSGDSNSTTFSGVVNTEESVWNANKEHFGNTATIVRPSKLPNSTTDDNNVLMIGSTSFTNNQYFASNDLTLASGSYYKLSFYVFTNYNNNSGTNKGARVTLLSNSGNKTLFDLYNIGQNDLSYMSDKNWHEIDILIKTGLNSETAVVRLGLEGVSGQVYFDKVELRTLNETTYNSADSFNPNTIKTYKVDLSKDYFSNNSYNKFNTQNDYVEEISNWSFNRNAQDVGVKAGIVSTNSSELSNIPATLSGNQEVLMISSLHDDYFSFTSNEQFTFNSSTWYKISINVLTNLKKNDEFYTGSDTGVYFTLADSKEIRIENISTNGVWKTYTIYAYLTDSVTSSIGLTLGYNGDDQQLAGIALFDDLKIETIDEETYNNEIKDADPDYIAKFINYTEETPDDSSDESTWTNEFNWFLVPSIITALAIIIAVVGYYVRKFSRERKPKVKTNYDRRKTLDKDIDKREKIALRQQIIKELNDEITGIDKEIEDFNKLADNELEKIKAEIVAEQEELKKQKLDIEIRKKEATAEREKQLKENPDFVNNTKAEKEYNNFIAKLDKTELSIQRKISDKEFKIELAKKNHEDKLSRYIERKEYIRMQIEKIEAEIEEIAKQEEQMWEEYKLAKADAKRRKAEYKAKVKAEKEAEKATAKRIANGKAKVEADKQKAEAQKKSNQGDNNSVDSSVETEIKQTSEPKEPKATPTTKAKTPANKSATKTTKSTKTTKAKEDNKDDNK